VSGKKDDLLAHPELGPSLWNIVTDYKESPESCDILRNSGLITPDLHFLLKRIALCKDDADKAETFRRALLELLRNWEHLGIPLTQKIFSWVAWELERLWWPDRQAEKQRRAQELSIRVDMAEAVNRKLGVARPRSAAKEAVAEEFGYASGEALRKAMQPNRVKSRHKPR
jgi:hypothetical protein